jgi:protein SCO1
LSKKGLLLSLGWACAAALVFFSALTVRRPGGGYPAWPAPQWSLVEKGGERLGKQALSGHVFIADFIFTTCTTACPRLSAKLAALQRKLPDPSLRFVSFSVDPARDTPELLRAYAEKWRPGETRWLLFATTPASLQLLSKGFQVTVEATGDAKDPILHTTRMFLVDGAGMVRGVYDVEDQAGLDKLEADARALSGAREAARTPEGKVDGLLLSQALGCRGCHDSEAIAPSLEGLAGSTVKLAGGHSTLADRDYLRESLTAPEAKIVNGYTATMPSYAWLSPAELEALTDWLLARIGTQPAAAPRTVEKDVICGMTVSAGPGVPKSEHQGRTYWFCSEECKHTFDAAPQKHASPTGQ